MMSNLKKGQAVPLVRVEPTVKKEAQVEIASEGSINELKGTIKSLTDNRKGASVCKDACTYWG